MYLQTFSRDLSLHESYRWNWRWLRARTASQAKRKRKEITFFTRISKWLNMALSKPFDYTTVAKHCQVDSVFNSCSQNLRSFELHPHLVSFMLGRRCMRWKCNSSQLMLKQRATQTHQGWSFLWSTRGRMKSTKTPTLFTSLRGLCVI